MSEIKASNQFQELFLELNYFNTNLAIQSIKRECNITDQSWNNWWSGRQWPAGNNIRKVIEVINRIKNQQDQQQP